jgi:Nucleotidyl transferase AbiEii toxin, Type IV TA system
MSELSKRLGSLRVADEPSGNNNSRQYNARLAYRSAVTGEDDFLKIEVGIREKVLHPPLDLPAATLLLDPNTKEPAVGLIPVRVLTSEEAFAEKVRAALTRPEPAIRDFFDVDSAIRNGRLKRLDPAFLELVADKLKVTPDPVDTSGGKVTLLTAQVEAQLKPVLRAVDYEGFLLSRAVGILEELASRCGSH